MARKKIIFKSDQTPAIVDLKNKFKKLSLAGIAMEESPDGDSQSAGSIENAMKQIQGMVRTYILASESKIGGEIPEDHPIIAWIEKHVAANLNRYNVGKTR